MKKLITLLTILLIIGNMSGQVISIYEQPYALDWGLKSLMCRDQNPMPHIKVGDNKYYILSYTPEKYNRPIYCGYRNERNLYLCLVEFIGKADNCGDIFKYEIVSPILQTDYIRCEDGIVSYTTYMAFENESDIYFDGYSGYMEMLENGDIMIRLVNVATDNEILERCDHNMKPYYKIYILKPTNNDKSSTLLFDIREQKVL
jgi:hypothetical protein